MLLGRSNVDSHCFFSATLSPEERKKLRRLKRLILRIFFIAWDSE